MSGSQIPAESLLSKPVRRTEYLDLGEIVAGDWHIIFCKDGHDAIVYFKGNRVDGVHSIRVNATAGHLITINIEFIPMLVRDLH